MSIFDKIFNLSDAEDYVECEDGVWRPPTPDQMASYKFPQRGKGNATEIRLQKGISHLKVNADTRTPLEKATDSCYDAMSQADG